MSSLPLTLIGVVLALLLFRSTLNMFSIIGVVMLMGLVTKNAILLVDFAIRSRQAARPNTTGPRRRPGLGRHRRAAARRPGAAAPILMTTLAMVFGMVPLAFARSARARSSARPWARP